MSACASISSECWYSSICVSVGHLQQATSLIDEPPFLVGLAFELKNQQALNQQVSDRLAKNPPGRDPMTALDVMLNRDLLVSMASGKAYVPTSRIELG